MREHAPWGFSTWGDAALAQRAGGVRGDLDAALRLARSVEPLAEDLGSSSTPLFRALATLGSVDLSTARAAEPHLDATAILAQARRAGHDLPITEPEATWGVYAASAPGTSLRATRSEGTDAGWSLTGGKAWCSLGDRVSHALVTAQDDAGGQRLFAVGLREGPVSFDGGSWHPRGLRDITTGTLTLGGQQATAIGDPQWYLDRPGFSWGAVGVAAVWFGGPRPSRARSGARRAPGRRTRSLSTTSVGATCCCTALSPSCGMPRGSSTTREPPGRMLSSSPSESGPTSCPWPNRSSPSSAMPWVPPRSRWMPSTPPG